MSRGLACLRSLVECSSEPVRLVVLALDDETAAALPDIWSRLGREAELQILTVPGLLLRYPMLSDARSNRSLVEFYFTLTPFLCAEAVSRTKGGELAIYLDADLYFFADPKIAETAIGDAPVAVVEHRYPRALAHLSDLYGRFNVGWLAFRDTEIARACLARWQEQCVVACSDNPDAGGFADQKYLDEWPGKISGLAIVHHPGADFAPWNVERHELTIGRDKRLYVDGQPLIFFHFHRLRQLGISRYETDFGGFGRMSKLLRREIYGPYLRALDDADCKLKDIFQWKPGGALRRFKSQTSLAPKQVALGILARLRLFTGQRTVFLDGRALGPWRSLLYVR